MRILIADDEPFARQRLRTLLAREHDVEIAGECGNGPEVVERLSREAIDIVLLDIQMPGLNGFEVLPAIGGTEIPLVIFVTAHQEHALHAFEVRAFDYLLKPFEPARLRQTIERARTHLRRLKQESMAPSGRDRFAIRNGGRIYFLMASEIEWIEAEHNYVRLHAGSEAHLMRERLSVLEQELDRRQFRRIHRSTIVNINRVRELRPWFRGDYIVVLQNGKELTMSRTFRESLRDLL